MTLTTQTPKEIKNGNDSTTVFSFTFVINQASDLVVTHTTSGGVETTVTEGTGTTNYSVSLPTTPGNGSITYPATLGTELATNATLTLKRVVDIDQDTDLVNQGAWNPSQVEDALDYSRMVDLQQQDDIDRSVKFAVSADLTSFDVDVPAPVASKVIAINAANNGFELVAEPSASVTAAAASASAAAISATAAAGEATSTAPKYTFSTTTSMADPGTGLLRYNHGTVASVTAIAVDDLTADTGNPDVEAWLKTFDDSTSTIKGWIRLVEPGTPANYAIFNVTAVADNSGWVQLTVVHVDSNGTFGNTDSIRLFFSRTGDKGTTGDTGPTGSTGAAGADGEVSEATAVALAIALG
tara:strand:+ start:3964 stop:5025 length:1062 start_codon:yes stop_codon:yes gene_type:complete